MGKLKNIYFCIFIGVLINGKNIFDMNRLSKGFFIILNIFNIIWNNNSFKKEKKVKCIKWKFKEYLEILWFICKIVCLRYCVMKVMFIIKFLVINFKMFKLRFIRK